MPKRNNDIDVEDLITWNEKSIDGLLQLDFDELVVVLAHIANEACISTDLIKTARVDLDTFKTPRYHLPLSLHEAMFENAWLWQDVCRGKVDQLRVEANIRILDPVCRPNT